MVAQEDNQKSVENQLKDSLALILANLSQNDKSSELAKYRTEKDRK